MCPCLFLFVVGIVAILWVLPWVLRIRRSRVRSALSEQYGLTPDFSLIAFFHPFCTSRGGGERVLWAAIRSMQLDRKSKRKTTLIVVYTCDPQCIEKRTKVLEEVKSTFGVQLDARIPIHFVLLRTTRLLSPQLYPLLTLAGQALGSAVVGLEALIRLPPDVFLDTTGFACTLPLAKRLAGAKTAAYVHYPTISSDMISRVSTASHLAGVTYNNASWIRNSWIMTRVKLCYYRLLVKAYGWVGSPSNVDCVMTNSTWTRNHIMSLWGCFPYTVYPPCPTEDLAVEGSEQRQPWIVSVGQFRPEKNHELQIEAFANFLSRSGLDARPDAHSYRLLLVGGCRDEADSQRVAQIRELVHARKLDDLVQFHINIPYSTLKEYFHRSMINLHTMVDEHFGIGIVEGMAAGLITVAHDSGGPQTDIIGPNRAKFGPYHIRQITESVGVGFLARTAEQYADTFQHVLTRMSEAELAAMRTRARDWVQDRFSESCFSERWLDCMHRMGL